MTRYPKYINQQLLEELDHGVVLILSKGVITITAPNEFNGEDVVYQHPITVDRARQGAMFATFGVKRETTILHALSESKVWQQIGNFSNHLHGRSTALLSGLSWYLPGATPLDICCVNLSISVKQLDYLTRLGKELLDSGANHDDVIMTVIEENPLGVKETHSISLKDADGKVYNDIAGIYRMIFNVVVTE